MIEKQEIETKGNKEAKLELEIVKVAEKLGKLSNMLGKNGKGDKGGEYGH